MTLYQLNSVHELFVNTHYLCRLSSLLTHKCIVDGHFIVCLKLHSGLKLKKKHATFKSICNELKKLDFLILVQSIKPLTQIFKFRARSNYILVLIYSTI